MRQQNTRNPWPLALLLVVSVLGSLWASQTLGVSLVLAQPGTKPLPSSPEWKTYVSKEWGYSINYPSAWELQLGFRNRGDSPKYVIRERVSFLGPEGAEISVDVWEKAADTELVKWLDQTQLRFLELGGAVVPPTPNAVISGQQALVLSQPGSCTAPAYFFAYVPAGEKVLLVQYSASDGGSALATYREMLASFEAGAAPSEAKVVAPSQVKDVIPELPYTAPESEQCEYAPNSEGCCGYPQITHWQCSRDKVTKTHRGNCTYWAAYMRPDVGNVVRGNAGQWAESALSANFLVDSNPRVGDIMVIEADPGHVAYVTGISGSTLYVSEMNWCTTCPQKTASYSSSGKKFIHGKRDGSPTPVPPTPPTPAPAPTPAPDKVPALYAVDFVDDQNGWAIGAEYTVLRTANGGGSWFFQYSGGSTRLNDVSFVDVNRGWVVGDGGVILQTENGGITWTFQDSSITTNLHGVHFADSGRGWVVGAKGLILGTSNGGVTWKPQNSGTTLPLYGVYFLDAGRGWVVGASGTILHTTNGGQNWVSQSNNVTTLGSTSSTSPAEKVSSRLNRVFFLDKDRGWIVGTAGTVLSTMDGGANWTQLTTRTIQSLNGLHFFSGDKGWAVGDQDVVRHTATGGRNWVEQNTGTGAWLTDVQFLDDREGWAVGYFEGGEGVILHTTDGGLNWQIQTVLVGPTSPDPGGERGPGTPPSKWDHLINGWENGEIDEAFTWTHPAVTFDEKGRPQCNQQCLEAIRRSYNESAGNPIPIPVTITRYYGEVNGNNHITNTTSIFSTTIGIWAWDIDTQEDVSVSINGCALSRHPTGENDAWDYALLDTRECLRQLKFPSAPGRASDPTDPSDIPTGPDTANATNSITVAVDSPHKVLIGGVRLIVKAVRPVVLVPGFGGDANGYCWGKGSHADCDNGTLKGDETFYQYLGNLGLILEKPCNYKWSEEVIGYSPTLPITGWFKRVYYYQTGWTDDRDTDHDGIPDNRFPTTKIFHPRCFEASEKSMNGTGTLAVNAEHLKETINELRIRYGVAKVNLVGHSKGGLFSRAYASAGQTDAPYEGNVDALISISTPHLGAFLMDLAIDEKDLPDDWSKDMDCSGALGLLCKLPPNAIETSIDFLLMRWLGDFAPWYQQGNEISVTWVNEGSGKRTRVTPWNDSHRPAPGVFYHSIAATAGKADDPSRLDKDNHGTIEGLQDPGGGLSLGYQLQYYHPKDTKTSRGQSDIGIAAPSQRMKRIGRGFENAEKGCWWVRENHEESSRSLLVGRAVANALGLMVNSAGINSCDGSPSDPTIVPSTTVTAKLEGQAISVSPETSQPLLFSGSILTYGVSITVPFAVDGSDLEVMGNWSGDSQIRLELTDALGTRISPASAIGNPNIAYTETRGINSGTAQYVITDTVKGTWTAHVIAPASGSANRIDWDLLILQKSPITFTLSTTADAYPFGSPVILRGALFSDTLPLQGANVVVELSAPSGITGSITLLDDGLHNDLLAGDGIYGNQWVPPKPGQYAVSAAVTGTLPSGVPYMRQGRTLFWVVPVTAHFSDVYSDFGVDESGNGLFEKLRIQVGVVLDQNGQYGVSGVLATPDGTELGAAADVVSGTAGTNVTLNLDFDASMLLQRTSDGPVVLKDLSLMDKSADLNTDYRQTAYTTTNYSSLDFSGWEARVAGSISDHGVDTNGNGKFEYLEVRVPIEVRRAGTYTASLQIELADGSRITAPGVVSDTLPGIHQFPFQFNGPTIALHGMNGPYTVTNLIVRGPLGIALIMGAVGETQSYSYLDFEADALAPMSFMSSLPPYSTPAIMLSWGATDAPPSAGIAAYDVQYRVGRDGTWTDWLTGTTLTAYTFGPNAPVPVEIGRTYYFRVRARDFAGNQEAYRDGDGDTYTPVVRCLLEGDVDVDGDVDVADVQLMASIWSQTGRLPNDGNGVRVITAMDIMRVLAAWRSKCP